MHRFTGVWMRKFFKKEGGFNCWNLRKLSNSGKFEGIMDEILGFLVVLSLEVGLG